MKVVKSYKFRLYPTVQQEQELLQTVGACRWVYNYFLERRLTAYAVGQDYSRSEPYRELTLLRAQHPWLREVGVRPVQASIRQLDTAFTNFFRGNAEHPKFKKKGRSKQSFSKVRDWNLEDGRLVIKRGLNLKLRGTIPPISSATGTLTVSVTNTGKWYGSIIATEELPAQELAGGVGIDLGLTDLAITSDAEKFSNARCERRQAKKMKDLQQSLSRKSKGSKRRDKAKRAISLLHEKIANQRMNHLHQVSSAITRKNHALIAVEDLAVSNMLKNHKLARSIQDVSWRELLRQIEYKQLWKGGKFVKIYRFYPSSKTCSNCLSVEKEMPLKIREWMCGGCGITHDRDVNAARNILKQAEEQLGVEVYQPMKRGHAKA